MNESIQQQLSALFPEIQARQDAQTVATVTQGFQSEFTLGNQSAVDWNAAYEREMKRLFGKAEAVSVAQRRESLSNVSVNLAVSTCLFGMGAASLFMLAKSCTNRDPSPKFSL